MNLQPPPIMNTHAAGGSVANNSHRVSTSADRSSTVVALCEVAAESRRSSSSLNRVLGRMPSTEKYQAAPGVRPPSQASKEEIDVASSFSTCTPIEHLATTSSSDRTVSLAPSVISKASTLSSKSDQFRIEAMETVHPDVTNTSINENDLKREELSSSSSSSMNEIYGSASVPTCITYVTASLQSTEPIFTARKKELHFLSDVFHQDYHKWLLDDDFVSDDEDSDKDQYDYMYRRGYAEYSGRTSFVKRNGAYRKSHEIGPLLFAKTLDLDDTS